MKSSKRSTFTTSDIIHNHEGEAYIKASALVGKLKFPIVKAPFADGEIIVKLNRLTYVQIRSCGDFSLIESNQNKLRKKKLKVKDLIDVTRLQHAIAREALVSPSYDELIAECVPEGLIARHEAVIAECREQLNGIKPGPRQVELLEEIDKRELWTKWPLPNNFLAFVFDFAVSNDTSDIKKVFDDLLLEAAISAEKGHDNPVDHIEGNFTGFNREDINRRARYLLQLKRED